MANDDRQSELFKREVDEELRRDQLKLLWDRFAPLIIGVCVLIVAVTAGYRGWIWWHERQAAQAGDRFLAALEEIESGDRAKGEAELTAIAGEDAAGYGVLARLRLAGAKAAADQKAEAIAIYDAVAADGAISEPVRALARVRAGLLALDLGDLAGAKERATPLNVAGNPWRHAAREVLGLAAYKSAELQAARDYFTEIQQDAETPADLWTRSGLMISLIDGQLAAPAPESAAAPPTDAAGDGGEAAEAPTSDAPATVADPPATPESNPAPETEIPPQ